jgi:hypothetical protein
MPPHVIAALRSPGASGPHSRDSYDQRITEAWTATNDRDKILAADKADVIYCDSDEELQAILQHRTPCDHRAGSFVRRASYYDPDRNAHRPYYQVLTCPVATDQDAAAWEAIARAHGSCLIPRVSNYGGTDNPTDRRTEKTDRSVDPWGTEFVVEKGSGLHKPDTRLVYAPKRAKSLRSRRKNEDAGNLAEQKAVQQRKQAATAASQEAYRRRWGFAESAYSSLVNFWVRCAVPKALGVYVALHSDRMEDLRSAVTVLKTAWVAGEHLGHKKQLWRKNEKYRTLIEQLRQDLGQRLQGLDQGEETPPETVAAVRWLRRKIRSEYKACFPRRKGKVKAARREAA